MKNKPKKIIPLLLVLLSFAAHSGLAQYENPPKWEIGTDLLFLFDKNQLPDYSLFATRKLGDKGFALRGRLGFDMNFAHPLTVTDPVNDTDSQFFSESQSYDYLISGGLEKEFSKLILTKGTKLYWAVDLAFSQSIQNNQARTFQEDLGMMFIDQKRRNNIYTFAGSIGVKQSITPNISIRLESSLSYSRTKQRSEYSDIFLDSDSPTDKKELVNEAKSNPDSYMEYTGHWDRVRVVPFNQLLLTIQF